MPPRSSRTFRIIAASCLLAVLCADWVSALHVHESPHQTYQASGETMPVGAVESAEGFSVSSDDAHEEHSPAVADLDGQCALCRSNAQREEARPSRFESPFGHTPPLAHYADPVRRCASAIHSRLCAARAPPTHPTV